MIARIIKALLLIGVLTLIYYRRLTEEGELNSDGFAYRSDFAFAVVVILSALDIILERVKGRVGRRDAWTTAAYVALGGYAGFVILGTEVGLMRYGLDFDIKGIAILGKIGTGMALIMAVAKYAGQDSKYYIWLCRALWLPLVIPLLMGVAYLMSPGDYFAVYSQLLGVMILESDAEEYSPVRGGQRFVGLSANPFQIAVSCLVAISFMWTLSIKKLYQRQFAHAGLSLSYMLALVFLMLWSMTRSALLALGVVITVGALLSLISLRSHPGAVSMAMLVPVVVVLGAWTMLPNDLQDKVSERASADDGRSETWRYYTVVAADNPLGVGVNYERRFVTATAYQPDINAHNSVLASWMYGGVGSVVCLLMFWGIVAKVSRRYFQTLARSEVSELYIGTIAACGGLWFLTIFSGALFDDFTMCVVTGLVLAGPPFSQHVVRRDVGAGKNVVRESSERTG